MTVYRGMPVNLPAAASGRLTRDDRAAITLDRDGRLFLNREPTTRDTLAGQLRTDDILANQTDLIVAFDTGGLAHTPVTGAEFDRETGDVTTVTVTGVPTASLIGPNLFPDLSAVRRAVNTVSGTTAFTRPASTRWTRSRSPRGGSSWAASATTTSTPISRAGPRPPAPAPGSAASTTW
jgi:outer membrane receptor for monomeric catechols